MDTHAALRPVRRRVPLAGAVMASFALCGSGVATAADGTNPVIVQPDPVAPGGEFSVFDGGNCTGGTGAATFGGTDIPKLKLSMLRNQVGGTATVPPGTEPGEYTVTVTCGGGKADTADNADKGDKADRAGEFGTQGEAESEAQGDPAGGRHTFTGTLTVSAEAEVDVDSEANSEANSDVGPEGGPGAGSDAGTDAGPGEAVPKGGAHTGLGGGSGVGTTVTVVGGALLAGAVGWGVVAFLRRPRGGRG
ncbi:hypothetical protein AB0D04_23195 [Streptomyces sp. NPDC048483]|uniref:hypothetical protein n=1 Tax=Streptomyces sp. NPDC048483 TaxID=3154927 RepID=UPI00341F85AB